MTNLPALAGGENVAAPDFGGPDFAKMACRLCLMLDEQIAALECEATEPGYSENRVKALIALTKTLQAMEDMVQKQQEKAKDERDSGPGDDLDIVEFRAELARKLEALAAAEDEPVEPSDGEADT